MKLRSTIACAIGGLLLTTGAALAHHAFAAEFDINQPVKLQGKVQKMEWINPHAWIHVDVPGPDGKVVTWMVEGGSPNIPLRGGLTQETVVPGSVAPGAG